MNSSIVNFLNEGSSDPTAASHRTAAKAYYEFLLRHKASRAKDRLRFSRAQAKALKNWDPLKPPHLAPKLLAHDNFFAHYLIHTLKQIQDNHFGKPTLRARQGWLTWTIGVLGMNNEP